MFVPHSDMRPKPLTTFAIGPSFVKPTLFNAAVIGDRDIDVHVRQANIAGDSRPSLLAHHRHRPLERKGSGCEHTGSRTCCPVVAEGAKATPAGARARRDWSARSVWLGLRQQQRSRCGIDVRKMQIKRAFVAGGGSNSWYERSLARDAVSKAAPAVRLPALHRRPAAVIKRGDERDVDCKLGAAPQRQAIGDDLNASVVLASWVDIQVLDKHIESDHCPSFSAHRCSSTLKGAAPRPQKAGARASGEVVTTRIEVCAATASGRN